uniref:Mannosyltransferase n=1 Tax=Panagrellus redivivus TaxID=6233 RepID=A0A7E4W0A3_PANRE
MDNIQSSEWYLFMVMMIHIIMALFTKVEESFNVQAIHDLTYHGFEIEKYDHHEFPGVVPRTFAGPLVIAAVLKPMTWFMGFFDVSKEMVFLFARLILGSATLLSFGNFARAVERKFGRESATFLRLLALSQFHFMFYASRPLPNTFALILVLWVYQRFLDGQYLGAVKIATVAVFLLRFELILLFGPLFLIPILEKQLKIPQAIVTGLVTLFATLLVTVPLDSLLWQRWVWPEGEVLWFNVVENKSHNWGTSPFIWYFKSAIPKALGASTLLIPVGLFMDKRTWRLVFPAILFVILYSFLPHKELRFIIYAFPLLNLPVAVFCARIWINKSKSIIRFILALAVIGHFIANGLYAVSALYASSSNYPGGSALTHLQFKHRFLRNKPIAVHIDAFCAEAGISRFGQVFDAWEYNKTENLPVEELRRFDYLLFGDTTTENLRKELIANFSGTHKEHFSTEGFHKIVYKKYKGPIALPYPAFVFREKVIVLKKV